MEFIKATLDDIEDVCEMISQGRSFLKSRGVDQWQSDFPNYDKIKRDIDGSYGYLLKEDGKTIGYSALIVGEDPTYASIDGKWLTDNKNYLTVHRVVLSDSVRGKGYGDILFSYFLQYADENHIPSVRIDTHKDNLIMQKLINKNGFRYCGIITVDDGTKRNAYEFINNRI